MIAHLSIPAENARATALFFAAIIDGVVFNFPVVPGAFIAVARDGSGTAVEVYPLAMTHHPGIGQPNSTTEPTGITAMPWEDQIYAESTDRLPSGFHFAIATQQSVPEVMSRSHALGWRAVACNRGGLFGVVEVWVDNLYLVEVLVPEEVHSYRDLMNITRCAALFGPGIVPQ